MKYKNNETNQIKRLLTNIKVLNQAEMLEQELNAIVEDSAEIKTLDELNEAIETEIFYWEE
jgi:hypothetical protein